MDKLGLGRKMEQAVMRRWEWNGFKTWQPPRAKYGKKRVVPKNLFTTEPTGPIELVHVYRNTGQDIFGEFDFIAVKPWCPVNLVQVKRSRRKEAEVALDAIKSFADTYQCPIAPFLVLWAKERRTGAISFKAWEYTMVGWIHAGEWNDGKV